MNLMSLKRPPDRRVAYREGVYLSWTTFVRDVEATGAMLAKRGEKSWGLFMEDSYHFTVALLALLGSRKIAVILPNMQTGFIDSIIAYLDGLFTDTQSTFTKLPQIQFESSFDDRATPDKLLALNVPEGQVALFTSGSTGEPKFVAKRFSQLVFETQVLEGIWGTRIADSAVVSTVTHQHIYGLLFRIVWPFTSGRCVSTANCRYAENFVEQAMQLRRVVLVASPAYLKRMAESADLRGIASSVSMVFSSGGPLSNAAAVRLRDQLGFGVCEVYGSTETGGIAYRTQTDRNVDAPWTALPSVRVKSSSRDGSLIVHSPFEGSGEWFTTGDTAELLTDNTFRLRGRTDNIVKVEEKRVSLEEVERRLVALDLVEGAAATVQDTFRTSVVVVIVLSEKGKQFLENHAKVELQRRLKQELLRYFEPVALPKKWRFVDVLPVNSQGKLVRTELLQLFDRADVRRITTPEIEKTSLTDTEAQVILRIPPDLACFNGHFPGNPVLPGIVQVDWAIKLAQQYLRIPLRFYRMEALKFSAFITPGTRVTLFLNFDREKNTIRFRYSSESRNYSSGRVVFGPPL